MNLVLSEYTISYLDVSFCEKISVSSAKKKVFFKNVLAINYGNSIELLLNKTDFILPFFMRDIMRYVDLLFLFPFRFAAHKTYRVVTFFLLLFVGVVGDIASRHLWINELLIWGDLAF